MCRRAVRVKSQLKSHKRFANAFPTYCQLVDNARLYCTNALEGPPKVNSLFLIFSLNFSSFLKHLIRWHRAQKEHHSLLKNFNSGT